MMRTYLVTVRGSKSGSPWFEPEAMAAFIGAGDAVKVEVVETTATHAKERQVLKAANDLASAERDRSALLISFALGDIRKATRELRALTEKKS